MVNYPYPAVERAMNVQEVLLKAMSKEITWTGALMRGYHCCLNKPRISS
jgi:hypothetical protein